MFPVLIAATIFLVSLTAAARLLTRGGDQTAQLLRRLNVAQPALVSPEAAADIRRVELLSKIPWLNKWLSQIDISSRVRLLITQADLDWSVGSLLMTSFFGWLGTFCLLYLRFRGIVPALALSLLVAPIPTIYMLRCRRKRFAQFAEQLPEALDLLVSALRVGHSLMTAIGFLAQESREPLKREFLNCFEEQNYGVDLRATLMNLATRMPIQDVQIFVAAVLIQKESGGNLAEILECLSVTVRDRFRLQKQVRVHTAQGRATGWILSGLPVILGLGIYVMHPETISILWKNPTGLTLLYTAGAMNLVGGLIIRSIVSIRV